MPSHFDGDLEAERLITWMHGTILSPVGGSVSEEVESARAQCVPALALEAMTDGVVIYTHD